MAQAFQPPIPLRRLATISIRNFAPPVKNYRKPRALVASPDVPPPRNIAVIGGGLAGLATAYHLKVSASRYLRKRGAPQPNVTVITPKPASSGASAVAAGLLHPFTPRVKKLAWMGRRGVNAAEELLKAVQHHSAVPFYRQEGMLRLAINDRLKSDFLVAANRYPSEVEYMDPEETAFRFPQVNPLPAAFLPKAFVVDTKPYMQALWKECQNLGVRWLPETVHNVEAILGRSEGRYDTVIICAGAEVCGISDLAHVPITACRGQNVFVKTEATFPEVPVIAGKYVIPDYFGHGVLVGATFEYGEGQSIDSFLSEGNKIDTESAVEELKESVERLVPSFFSQREVLGANAGLRALPPRSEAGSVPIACRLSGLDKNVSAWVVTGLGSRGLLHHAYLGRVVAHAVAAGNEKLIPADARRFDIGLRGERMELAEDEVATAAAVHSQ